MAGELHKPKGTYKNSNCPSGIINDVNFLLSLSIWTWKNPFFKSTVLKTLALSNAFIWSSIKSRGNLATGVRAHEM